MTLGLMAALLLGSYQEKAPADKWKIEFTLRLEQKDGLHVFVVEGTADVPPDTVLRARVYALEIVDDFRLGKREDEEPMVWEGDDGQPAYPSFIPERGKFRQEVYRFVRKPHSINYRARIHYEPRDQKAIVAVKVGNDDFSRPADLRLGTDADYREELAARVKETADDLATVEKLFGELSDAHAKKLDAEAWKKWRGPWEARVEILEDRNQERYRLWAVPLEHHAKMYVGGACDMLRRIANASEEKRERIDQRLKGLHDYIEQAIDVTGINAPLDPRTVGPILRAYEQAIAPLRSNGGPAVLRKARHDGIVALLALPPLLENRKRAYLYVTDVGSRFRRLLDVMEAGTAEDIQAALKDHDAALTALKKISRLE